MLKNDESLPLVLPSSGKVLKIENYEHNDMTRFQFPDSAAIAILNLKALNDFNNLKTCKSHD